MSAPTLHKHLFQEGTPRTLKPSSSVPWFIQTDSCYEVHDGEVAAGVGAVLFDPNGKVIRFFSHKLSDVVVQHLNPGLSKKTAIFECEFFAAFTAFWLWDPTVRKAL